MLGSMKKTAMRIEKTADLVSRHKHILWSRFALRASVVSVAIAFGALFFRNLDLVPDLSYVDVKILSGSHEGQYYSMIERLVSAAADQQARISNVTTRGSRENLDRLLAAQENCEVQLGLVQDGFDRQTYQGLELIGRIGRTEALMILGRNADNIHRLADLQGLTIGVGPERSGSAFLAERLLKAADFETLQIPAAVERWPVYREGQAAPDTDGRYVYEGANSGQGKTVDWSTAARLARRGNMLLAGGLNAGNVATAIRAVRPFGVDASSGLESAPGKKDPERITDFINAVRAAEKHL